LIEFIEAELLNLLEITLSAMLDQLIKLVKQNADTAIVKNNALPNQFNNAAIEEVASQIFSGMQTQVKSGTMQMPR